MFDGKKRMQPGINDSVRKCIVGFCLKFSSLVFIHIWSLLSNIIIILDSYYMLGIVLSAMYNFLIFPFYEVNFPLIRWGQWGRKYIWSPLKAEGFSPFERVQCGSVWSEVKGRIHFYVFWFCETTIQLIYTWLCHADLEKWLTNL